MNRTQTAPKSNAPVQSLLFCDKKSQIMQYEKFDTPIPQGEVDYKGISNQPFHFILVTLQDKTVFKYKIAGGAKC